MTRASTKRRRKRNAATVRKRAASLQRFVNSWLDGADSNIRHKRRAAARAQVDVVRVALNDVPGLVEDAIMSGVPHANAEIQRLRAAMVHAMDDCEAAADHKGNPVSTKSVLLGVAGRLKAALEKR
jgi:hypothetical protein